MTCTLISEANGYELLKRYGIPVPRYAVVRTAEDARYSAEEIGFAPGAKIVSPRAVHKSDAGGVGVRGTRGFREQVIPTGDEICGYHVNPNDPSDIARYIIKILKNPELAAKRGGNGRLRVLEHFTGNRIADNTLLAYQELVDTSSTGTES